MKITKHARLLSLLLVLMMALSTGMVFAEEGAQEATPAETPEVVLDEEATVVTGEEPAVLEEAPVEEAVVEEAVMEGEAPLPVVTLYGAKNYGDASDNGFTLSWSIDNPAGLTGYQILMNGVNVTSLAVSVNGLVCESPVATLPATASSAVILAPAGAANYTVLAVGPNVQSNPVTTNVAGGAILDEIRYEDHGLVWYGKTKKKVKIYTTAKSKKVVATLKKGTYVTAIGKFPKKVPKFKQPSKVQVMTSDGTVGWLKYSDLKGGVKGAVDVKHDYSRSVKEAFVNYKGYSSTSKYLIWVSPRTQKAYVFTGSKGNWKLHDTYRVTTGRFSHPTKAYQTGIFKKKAKVFKVTEKGRRYYFKYASYFGSGVSFHTGTWWASSNKVRGVVAKSGKPGTFGCLRMYTKEAQWIYNNVPMNSMTIVTKKA